MMKSMKELLQKAKQEGYGIAAPNVWNWESVRSVFEAADELKAPVIIDVAAPHGIEECAHMVHFYESKYPEVVFALNLDHGGPYEDCIRALRAGYSSIMVDRSTLSFDQNVKEVKEIVKVAHAVGVSVEAELGHVGQGFEYQSTRDAGLTHKDEAITFMEQTGADCLAVSIGTSHGAYKGEPKLDFDLLKELHEIIKEPLVLHGGSGTGNDNLQKAVCIGIQKVNLATDLSNASLDKMCEILGMQYEHMVKSGPWCEVLMRHMADAYKEALMQYMQLFGSVGKAV